MAIAPVRAFSRVKDLGLTSIFHQVLSRSRNELYIVDGRKLTMKKSVEVLQYFRDIKKIDSLTNIENENQNCLPANLEPLVRKYLPKGTPSKRSVVLVDNGDHYLLYPKNQDFLVDLSLKYSVLVYLYTDFNLEKLSYEPSMTGSPIYIYDLTAYNSKFMRYITSRTEVKGNYPFFRDSST